MLAVEQDSEVFRSVRNKNKQLGIRHKSFSLFVRIGFVVFYRRTVERQVEIPAMEIVPLLRIHEIAAQLFLFLKDGNDTKVNPHTHVRTHTHTRDACANSDNPPQTHKQKQKRHTRRRKEEARIKRLCFRIGNCAFWQFASPLATGGSSSRSAGAQSFTCDLKIK